MSLSLHFTLTLDDFRVRGAGGSGLGARGGDQTQTHNDLSLTSAGLRSGMRMRTRLGSCLSSEAAVFCEGEAEVRGWDLTWAGFEE